MAIFDGKITRYLGQIGDESPTIEKAIANSTRWREFELDAEEWLVVRASAAVVAALLLALGWPE